VVAERGDGAGSAVRIRPGTPADVPRALAIWRDAVDATHGFLTPADRIEIDRLVAEDFLPKVELWLAEANGVVLGFLVMDGDMIDALFVDPAAHGRGVGTALVEHALMLVPNALVDASEQASNAVPFYEAKGFERVGRSETDPQGRPYPLIHFRHPGAAH
jgi:putative acetyltransferase